jgi:glycosyltransferase domain-containing protein
MNNVTILLPLKDRPQYTKRFLSHLNESVCPFEIIIADGGKDKEIQSILELPSNFPNLSYKYIRYPYDETMDDFYEKMANAVTEINTDLVMVMDNDDFIHIDGIHKCLEILQSAQYSSARGRIDSMNGHNMYTKYPNSITGQTACDRLIDQTKHFHGNWHNVTRTNYVQACWSMINITKPQNMRFTEQLTGYLNVMWGDGYRGDFPWLIHDHGERIKTENGSLNSHFPDQKTWIMSDYWLEEFNKMTEIIGVSIAEYDKIPIDDAMNIFTETYPYKLPDLKDILYNRIAEAKDLGYNSTRINKLFDTIKRNNITND